MNICRQCGILLEENVSKCPLCNRAVEGEHDSDNRWYPIYTAHINQASRKMCSRVFLFILITAISICALINLLTGITNPWFLYVTCPILYLILLIYNTILSKIHAGAKILFQIFGISAMLFMLDFVSGYSRWSVNIVIPFLFILGTFMTTLIILKKKMLWSEYVGYEIVMILIGFIPVLLYATRVSSVLWAGATSALYSFLTMVGMLIFSNKKFKNEVKSRFYF